MVHVTIISVLYFFVGCCSVDAQMTSAADASGVVFHNIGASGQYDQVVNMGCSNTNAATCEKTPFQVSGPLAPFHEDLTLVLRGPMVVDNIAVFEQMEMEQEQQTYAAPSWQKVSSFSKSQLQSSNMVFLNNHGGDPAKSGAFNFCHGMSQSFATCDGQDAASSNQVFTGELDDNLEINVMSATSCDEPGRESACGTGYRWGVAYSGWRGKFRGHKLFAIQARMPHAGDRDLPAIWLLNGQIVRSAQYGCNCRGMGKAGGCGEIDVAEVLEANHDVLSSSVYSFQNAVSSLNYAPRPVDNSALFLVILDEEPQANGNSNGVVQVLKLPSSAAALNATTNLFDASFLSDYQVHSMQIFANQLATQFTL